MPNPSRTTHAFVLSIGLAWITSPAVMAQSITQESCADLANLTLEATQISLPTTGGSVQSATWNADGSEVAYCAVLGSIAPVDPEAPPINWQLNLPENWNGRLLQFGGGGYNGVLPKTLARSTSSPETIPTPLERGYATFGGDSGHSAANSNDASFAVNAEALENYAFAHIRKTLDAAEFVVEKSYGRPAEKTYFVGGSTGGREGLTAIIRWPEAYDGVVSYYPTAAFVGLRLWGAALNRAVYDDNSSGWISPDLVKTIAEYAIEQCDVLDGLEDGLVSNVEACRAKSSAVLENFACGEGDDAAACLSPTQIERTIKVYHDGYELPYELANGFTRYPGYNSLEGILMNLGTEPGYQEPVISGPNAHHAARAYEFFQHFVNQDSNLDYQTFDITEPGAYMDRLLSISDMIDANNPDLSAFADKGGKLILVQGTEDPSVTPWGTVAYYEAIKETLGEEQTASFARFYMLPGLAHGGGNFNPGWDSLGALDNWASNNVPPSGYVAVDNTDSETRGRMLPVCEYPSWPQYDGSGDARLASSFTCETN